MATFPTRDRVLEIIESHAPEKLKAALRDNLAPAVALLLEKADDENIAVGQSKIGGAPDVPIDFVWPMWNEKPLGFVAQFNLEEVAPFDLNTELPPSGLLSFFYAIEEQPWGAKEEQGAWRVFHWPEKFELQRADFPFESPRDILPSHQIGFDVHWQTPVFWAMELSKETCDLEQEERNKFYDFQDKLRESCPKGERHQLLGFAEDIQDDLPISVCTTLNSMVRAKDESNFAFFQRLRAANADKWRLLFQLDSQYNSQGIGTYSEDWMWGDAGMIYFCIHEDDLKARHFDNVWLQLQCG